MTAPSGPDQELLRLLREIAAADAPAMFDRARANAMARAERLIEDALVEELMAAATARMRTAPEPEEASPVPEVAGGAPEVGEPFEAAERAPEPTGPDTAEAWWIYCILWGTDAYELPAELEGVEPGSRVEVIEDGDLAALVSRVPLSDYGDERLRDHLENLEWVERTARRHEDVLEAALHAATIVPLRLCTLFQTRDGVHGLLREHREAVRQGLSRVDGCIEWGVKVFSDPSASNGHTPHSSDDAESSGAAYLQRRQQERVLAEKASEVRVRCVEVVQQRIGALSRDSTSNPPQRPEVHGRELTMLLNGAYLVERGRTAELRRAVETLHEEWHALGFTIELTGPWPPYNFVSGAAGVLS